VLAESVTAPRVKSVNIGTLVPNRAKDNTTAINKRPATGPVWVRDPGPLKGKSGLEGDNVGDKKNHGGPGQAVYAFAREDLDRWEVELDRQLPDGMFGENLTTLGIDPNTALIGERWKIGDQLVLQVTGPRMPCKTFAQRMAVHAWARRFTGSGRPGAYLMVVQSGPVKVGDPISIVHRPAHGVDVTTALFAFTIKPKLLPDLLAAEAYLVPGMREEVEKGLQKATGSLELGQQ